MLMQFMALHILLPEETDSLQVAIKLSNICRAYLAISI